MTRHDRPARSALAARWDLDPEVTFLNHGSFGACPTAVLDAQAELRRRLEREPVRFFVRELPALLATAREALAPVLGAKADDLAFVPNATTGVSTVLASLELGPGDELLTTSHVYGACRNALARAAAARGATLVVAEVPFPLGHADEVIDAVVRATTRRTRLALIDHVTSPTGLVFPVGRIVSALHERGVDVLVDAAHAPGMVPMALDALGAAWTTGNCHKWLCTPKGSAFLHVRRDKQAALRPLVTSHGATQPLRGQSRFRLEFDWTGTADPTAPLVLPDALRVLGGLVEGGLAGVRQRNRALALEARGILMRHLGLATPPAPDDLIGSLAALPLPDAPPGTPGPSPLGVDPLQDALWERHRIEVPVFPWPAGPRRLVRVAAQLYNAPAEYELLGRALRELLDEGR